MKNERAMSLFLLHQKLNFWSIFIYDFEHYKAFYEIIPMIPKATVCNFLLSSVEGDCNQNYD